MTYQNLWERAKPMLRENSILLNVYSRKAKFQTNEFFSTLRNIAGGWC